MTAENPSPIFQDGPNWYFWDETWTMFMGPFDSELAASDALEEYIARLSAIQTMSSGGLLGGKHRIDGETLETRD